ncbi:MAG: glycosyltransferase family 2 protein [Bacteroidota bacterium]
MPEIKLSVVVPLYNNGDVVKRALHSIFSQTVSGFEVVVVNDGSTDGGEKIVRDLNDEHIRVVDQENKGVSAARNRGIAEARNELVAFLDADDEWKPDFLETICRLNQTFSTCSVFATHYLYKELDGNIRPPILHGILQGPWEGVLENYFEIAAHSDPPLWSSAIAVKKSALLSIGGFPEGIAIGEDLLTWARLAVNYQIAFSKRPSAVFWLRGSLTGYPTRIPEIPDSVGDQLIALLPQVRSNQRKSFFQYVGMWHRMRASMFVQRGDSSNALAEAVKMLHYSKMSPQATAYFLLAITPKMIRKFVLQIFTFIKRVRRRIFIG